MTYCTSPPIRELVDDDTPRPPQGENPLHSAQHRRWLRVADLVKVAGSESRQRD
ncbi:MAG: hypothetical protein AAFX65_11670 [Cyanobacteria bacterium J06638_7]